MFVFDRCATTPSGASRSFKLCEAKFPNAQLSQSYLISPYEQPEISTQPGATCERLLRRCGFGIAPPLPTAAGVLSIDERAMLRCLSLAAARPTKAANGRRPLDRDGLTATSIATRLGWMVTKNGKPAPDVARVRRLLEPLFAGGLLVRLGEGSGARYTTPQIAGVQPLAVGEPPVDQPALRR
jgi:hypothetical protein